jgi:hypothetical protein
MPSSRKFGDAPAGAFGVRPSAFGLRSACLEAAAFLAVAACAGRSRPSGRGEAQPPRVADAVPAAAGPDAPATPGTPDAAGSGEATAAVPAGEEFARVERAGEDAVRFAGDTARACDGGDARACFNLANKYEEGIGVPRDMAYAHGIYARLCDRGRGLACHRLGELLLWDSGPPKDEPRALRLFGQACDLGFAGSCAELGDFHAYGRHAEADLGAALRWHARACTIGYHAACFAHLDASTRAESQGVPVPEAPGPPTGEVPAPEPEAACPALFRETTAAGGGPRLDRGLDEVPPETMLRALPEAIDGWECGERGSWHGGVAGTMSGAARQTCRAGERSADFAIYDMFMNCTLQPGTGAVMTGLPGNDRREVVVAGLPAAVRTLGASRTLTIWIRDRCEVAVSGGPPATDEDLVALAGRIDFDLLRAECAKRDHPLHRGVVLPRPEAWSTP